MAASPSSYAISISLIRRPLIEGMAEWVIFIKADLGYKWGSLPGYLALGKRKNFIKGLEIVGEDV
jgi:hypothetical protein